MRAGNSLFSETGTTRAILFSLAALDTGYDPDSSSTRDTRILVDVFLAVDWNCVASAESAKLILIITITERVDSIIASRSKLATHRFLRG
jgi:hypothetical protein